MVFALGIVIVGFLAAIIVNELWIGTKANPVGPTTRTAIDSVRRAYLRSRITGDYWEDEMLKQARVITNCSPNDRIAFFRSIVLLCDLDTSRAVLFVEILGKDAEALRQNLIELRNRSEFRRLSRRQRQEVTNWVEELNFVVEDLSE